MPVLDIPSGPYVKWGDRRNSRVYIKRKFSWKFYTLGSRFDTDFSASVPLKLELHWPREIFGDDRQLNKVTDRIAAGLIESAKKRRATKQPYVAVKCRLQQPGHPKASLTLPSESLYLLKGEGVGHLAIGIYTHCFFPFIPDFVATPPRGMGLYARRITRLLPAALRSVQYDCIPFLHGM